ncbi:MAG: nucleotidyltransferase substrate binding protein [Deltaproteobacteria bacterium]|nr:nucleotidyltransferase substrate binding protein [Deltaproteobacteria bacterium]
MRKTNTASVREPMSESYVVLGAINIYPLIKAQAVFEGFRKNLGSEQEKAGAIQSFEFCYELAWRMIKKVLAQKGVEVASPRDSFREGARSGLIGDPEVWFDFQKKRNSTVHTYNIEVMDELVNILPRFSEELDDLVRKLKAVK